jgi:hypothetical protein
MLTIPRTVFGQLFMGSISGLVTDSTGGVVADVAITVTVGIVNLIAE